jgi:hypothetical protein
VRDERRSISAQFNANESEAPFGGGLVLRAIFSSLTAFVAAGLWPRSPLAKAIVFVLIIKLLGIAGMRVFMFPQSAQPAVDANVMARVLGVTDPAH